MKCGLFRDKLKLIVLVWIMGGGLEIVILIKVLNIEKDVRECVWINGEG